VILSSLS